MSTDATVIMSLDELVERVEDSPDLFLRYSAGPDADAADGPSHDAEADVAMVGWSVTPLGPEPWWTRSTKDWIARRVRKYVDLASESARRPWVLRGRQTGRGPDHEPLVCDMDFVAWLSDEVLRAADAYYTDVFDRGRASRGVWTS